ncbi:hypothetical protein ACFQOZ_20355 [Comamonas endophytica]|uniref:hypothetical protein n=1 Tax=Comamonas endophytica TaxID=2949090 RepID=UPI003617992F
MTKPTRRKASQSAIDVDAKELVQGDGAGTQIIPLALLPPDPADGADKPFATFFIQRKNQGSNFKKPNPWSTTSRMPS